MNMWSGCEFVLSRHRFDTKVGRLNFFWSVSLLISPKHLHVFKNTCTCKRAVEAAKSNHIIY